MRINPEELHIRDSAWIGALYTGPSSVSLLSLAEPDFTDTCKGIRDKYPPAAHMTGTPLGGERLARAQINHTDGNLVFGTIDHEIHRKRRAAVSPFFSKYNISSAESMIYEKMNTFCAKMSRDTADGGAIELRKMYLAMTTDTLSAHCFQKSLDLLKDDRRTDDWKRTIGAVSGLTPLIKQFTWIIPLALRLPLCLIQRVVPNLARIVALRRVGPLYSPFEIIQVTKVLNPGLENTSKGSHTRSSCCKNGKANSVFIQ